MEVIQYVEQLASAIERCYTLYDKQRNNIPAAMLLSSAEEKMLLIHCMAARGTVQDKEFYYGDIAIAYLRHFPEHGRIAYQTIQFHNMDHQSILIEPHRWLDWLDLLDHQQRYYFDVGKSPIKQSPVVLKRLNPYMIPDILLDDFNFILRIGSMY